MSYKPLTNEDLEYLETDIEAWSSGKQVYLTEQARRANHLAKAIKWFAINPNGWTAETFAPVRETLAAYLAGTAQPSAEAHILDLDASEQLARAALDVVASTNIQFDNDRLDRARYVPGLAKAVLELSEKLRNLLDEPDGRKTSRAQWKYLAGEAERDRDQWRARALEAEKVCFQYGAGTKEACDLAMQTWRATRKEP